jgi:UDP-N-acetylmuramoyl-tripeptide--D-alanyl-D-alanine ligase
MEIHELHALFSECSLVCTDTRKIEQDCLFFALKGDNFNGNKFAKQALEKGAKYAIVDEAEHASDPKCILVLDVLSTLQELATYHRGTFKIPFIGITGSNGKTTSKELIRDVLSQRYNVLATKGNLNNHIGVPLTLLEVNETHDVAIIEMGANHVEEIAFLCRIAKPSHGLITNIGEAHIGEFGGFENIIKGKSELYDHLRATDGLVFVNGDDALLLDKAADIDQVTYGYGALLDYQGRITGADPYLIVEVRPDDEEIKTQLVGDYNFSNVMAALCIGQHFQVALSDMISAIDAYAPTNNRSQLMERNGRRIILDAYNANPTSMKAALQNFANMEGTGKMVILGDMLELGDESQTAHQEIAALTGDLGLKGIFIGAEFSEALKNPKHRTFKDTALAQEEIQALDAEHQLILIKGSRGIKLESLVDSL